MFGRCKSARERDPKAADLWKEMEALPKRGAGKNLRKRLFVFAWSDHKATSGVDFGEAFWKEQQSFSVSNIDTKKGVWCTRGRLEQLVGS